MKRKAFLQFQLRSICDLLPRPRSQRRHDPRQFAPVLRHSVRLQSATISSQLANVDGIAGKCKCGDVLQVLMLNYKKCFIVGEPVRLFSNSGVHQYDVHANRADHQQPTVSRVDDHDDAAGDDRYAR